MRPVPQHFTVGPGPAIQPVDAVAALLVLPDRRYLMQLRDDRPELIYPGHWACFGGALQPGEAALDALRRELLEELELDMREAQPFGTFAFDLRPAGLGHFQRTYFVVALSAEGAGKLVLHEGARLEAFEVQHLLSREPVAPHDAFALWLHAARQRIAARAG